MMVMFHLVLLSRCPKFRVNRLVLFVQSKNSTSEPPGSMNTGPSMVVFPGVSGTSGDEWGVIMGHPFAFDAEPLTSHAWNKRHASS